MTPAYEIRPATPADATLFAHHRVRMFRDMGRTTPDLEPTLFEACAKYFVRALTTGEYAGWVAEQTAPSPTPVGGAGVQFRPLLPRPDPLGHYLLVGSEGLVLNVYVDEGHRRRGIARRLMETLIAWAPGAGIARLVLHTSDDGRSLYEALGFRESNEMLFPPFGPPASGVAPESQEGSEGVER